MIPSSLLGLVLFAASLGPGYVYVRVAELRNPRPERSALAEAVEMVSLGAGATLLSAGLVLVVGDGIGAIDPGQLVRDDERYLADHPVRAFGSLVVLLGLAYGGAFLSAQLVHRGREAVVSPAGTTWHRAFWANLPADSVTLATIELRDGRKVVGVLSGFTAESGENREIYLVPPMAVQASADSKLMTSDDHFLLLRERDIAYIAGRYSKANQTDGASR